MVKRKLLIAGVPIIIAAAYSMYKDSETNLHGQDKATCKKNFQRAHGNKSKGKKKLKFEDDERESDEEKTNLQKSAKNDCSKCKLVEQNLLKYIEQNES